MNLVERWVQARPTIPLISQAWDEFGVNLDTRLCQDMITAVCCGDVERVSVLLSCGVPAEFYTDEDTTGNRSPLDYAISRGKTAVVARLISGGAIFYESERQECEPIFWAIQCNQVEMVHFLYQRLRSNRLSVWSRGVTPLQYAAMCGCVDVVEQLLRDGAPVSGFDEAHCVRGFGIERYYNQCPAVNTASIYGHADVVELLLDWGADINGRDIDGSTPLMLATEFSNDSVIKVLLERGADAGLRDNDGNDLDYYRRTTD